MGRSSAITVCEIDCIVLEGVGMAGVGGTHPVTIAVTKGNGETPPRVGRDSERWAGSRAESTVHRVSTLHMVCLCVKLFLKTPFS